jgi:hypothetical protein
MRYLISICIAILFSVSVFSQKKNNTAISVYTSAFNSAVVKNNGQGWGQWDLDRAFLIGAGYRIGLSRWLSLNTGLEYADYRFSFAVHQEFSGWIIEFPPYQDSKGSISMLSLPVFVRADFLKYAFVQAGGMIDMQVNSQMVNGDFSGLGIQVGAGLKYDTKNKIGFFFNPFFQWHSMVKFDGKFPKDRKLNTAGIHLGIHYRL